MDNTKYTKGKWYVSESNESEKTISSEYFRICEVKHFKNKIHEILLEPSESEGKANALLISKAPEMLEMLEKILQFNIEDAPNIKEEIKQLIKEATEL